MSSRDSFSEGKQGLALHFGVSRPAVGIGATLTSPPGDIEAFSKIARDNGFETHCFSNEQATAEAFLGELGRAAGRLKAGDTLLLHFSGHGVQVADTDGDERDGRDEAITLFDRLVLDDEIKAKLMAFNRGVDIIVVVDACHSGTIIDDEGPGVPQANVLSFSATNDARLARDGLFSSVLLRNLGPQQPPRWDPTRPQTPRSYAALYRLVRWDDFGRWDDASEPPPGGHGVGTAWTTPGASLRLDPLGTPEVHASGPEGEDLLRSPPFSVGRGRR